MSSSERRTISCTLLLHEIGEKSRSKQGLKKSQSFRLEFPGRSEYFGSS
jgi:hypothetical protein